VTLGQLLKSKRSELGRSLEQISAATKIHTKILSALEEDQYSELPARTFTRGFIVTYTKALKLDSEQVLKEYHDFLESKFAERHDRDKGHQGYVFEGKELEQNKRWMIIGATVAAVFAISVFLVFKPQNHHRNEKHKEFAEESTPTPADPNDAADTDITPPAITTADKSTPLNLENSSSVKASPTSSSLVTSVASTKASPAASSSAVPAPPTASASAKASPSTAPSAAPTATAVASASANPEASASPTATPKEDKLNKGDDLVSKDVKRRVIFQATDDVWVRYQVDQKPVMMIILRKGRQLVMKAKDQIRVETNNSSALQYKTKGQYINLDQNQFSVEGDGTLKGLPAGSIAPTAIPDSIPTSPNP
jgi:cytoskeleton protein RodZ